MAEKNDPKDQKDPKDKKSKEDDEDTKEKKPLTMKKVIILMSAAFLLVLIITVISLVLILKQAPGTAVTNEVQKEVSKEKAVNKAEPKKNENKDEENSGKVDDEAGSAESKRAFFYTVKPVFIVNLDSNRVKFLQVGVDIMAKKQETITKITDNLPIIKNELVTLFSNKSYEQVKTLDGREALRREALKVVKGVLEKETGGDSGVEDILFTSFVMQ